ncbi:MAG TPA: NAD(P)-dependent oxidoreductase, partial [Isosphaeraceae bacterium]
MRADHADDPGAEARGLPILDLNAAEAEDLEDEPRTVLITGACGNIGRKLRAAWADVYDLVPIDSAAGPDDPDAIAADLSEWDDGWIAHFHGVDAVVHLAANPDEFATWEALRRPNLDALNNVLLASVLAGVERVVFASSVHVMGGYRDAGAGPIAVDLPPRPDGPYGATKLMGERLGRACALAFDLTFVALRLGWVQR